MVSAVMSLRIWVNNTTSSCRESGLVQAESLLMPVRPPVTQKDTASALAKQSLQFPSLRQVIDKANWSLPSTQASKGGSPYRGVTRNVTKGLVPHVNIGIIGTNAFHSRELADQSSSMGIRTSARTTTVQSRGSRGTIVDHDSSAIRLGR